MSALAEKLEEAGIDTLGAKFTNICYEAIRQKPDNHIQAWMIVGDLFGYEFMAKLMRDMQPKGQTIEPKFHPAPSPSLPSRNAVSAAINAPKPYKPRVIPPERLEKDRKMAQTIRSKYMNSTGQNWSDVSWHELHGLSRDGKEAMALLKAGPAGVPNDGRSVGDVLGVKKVDEIISRVRES